MRHRFNPGGNRQLNRALDTISITQIRSDTEGRAYYERKRAAGKTKREALRCLKRRLSDIVFTTMRRRGAIASATLEAGGAAGHAARRATPPLLPVESVHGLAVASRP